MHVLRLEWDFVLQIWNVIYSEGIVHDKLHVTCTMSCRFRNTRGTIVTIFISCNNDNDRVHNLHTSKPAVSMGQTVGGTIMHVFNINIMSVHVSIILCVWCRSSLYDHYLTCIIL